MATLLIVLGTALLSLIAGVLRFEVVFGALLVTPIVAYLAAQDSRIALIVILVLLVGAIAVLRRKFWEVAPEGAGSRAIPLFIWAGSYVLFYNLCLLWPDFIAMGERIRDYALLAGVIRNPLAPEEPWMTGTPLNYYAYWYRVGALFKVVGEIPVWEVYHQLISFTFALFFTGVFELLRRYAALSVFGATAGALLVTIGSNVQGVIHFFAADGNWWGPSRVVEGAINEFPAWSFLLGDAHPHYLNLGFVPFAILVGVGIVRSAKSRVEQIAEALVGALVALAWVFNTNAWETPVVIGLLLSAAAVALLCRAFQPSQMPWSIDHQGRQRLLVLVAVAIPLVVSLALSVQNIQSPNMPLKFVAAPVTRTPLNELMLHWGVPFGMIAIGLVAVLSRWFVIGVVVLFVIAWTSQMSWLFILLLIGLGAAQLLKTIRLRPGEASSPVPFFQELFWGVIGLSGLVFILIPEFLYFDDSYGPEIDRMNTIFKFYSASWFMVHCYAFWLLSRVAAKFQLPQLRGTIIVFLIVMCGFFLRTVDLRKSKDPSIQPASQGLSELDRKYSGAGKTIQELERLPRGAVLEAQGGAYSLTTHVATLSGNPSYLGWANHVGLLARNDEERKELTRRQEVTTTLYNSTDCNETASILEREQIRYLVLGPLERAAFPGITPDRYGCLQLATGNGEYLIFSNERRVG